MECGIAVCRAMHTAGHQIEFWTSRPEFIREETEEWLYDHVGPWTADCPVRMRKDGDHRPDTSVKIEYLQQLPVGRKPFMIFEDRRQMVSAYRKLGLIVYQVANGDY